MLPCAGGGCPCSRPDNSLGLSQGLGNQMPFRWILVWAVGRKSSAAAGRPSFYSISWVWITCFKAAPMGQVASVREGWVPGLRQPSGARERQHLSMKDDPNTIKGSVGVKARGVWLVARTELLHCRISEITLPAWSQGAILSQQQSPGYPSQTSPGSWLGQISACDRGRGQETARG